MSARDVKVEMRVCGLLTKHAVDIRKLDFSCVRGVVYLRGYALYDRSTRKVNDSDMFNIRREILKIPDVKDVILKLEQAA